MKKKSKPRPKAKPRRRISVQQAEALQEALRRLDQAPTLPDFALLGHVEETPPVIPAFLSRPAAPPVNSRFAISSVDAEEKLMRAIGRVASSSKLPDIGPMRLGDFWDREFGSAPFEESITFEQFARMRARSLLEKRSFGPQKIFGILAAVERALGETPIVTLSQQAAAPATAVPRAPAARLWTGGSDSVPSIGRAALRLFENQLALVPESLSPLVRLMRKVPSTLTEQEFVLLWLLQDAHEDLVTQLMRIDRATLISLHKGACGKLDTLLSTEASELRSYWDIALRSPGIALHKLLEIFKEPALDQEFVEGLVRVLLTSIGAQHPIAFGVDLSGYWTMNPSALQMSMSSVLASLPKSDEVIRQEFQTVFPFIDYAILAEVLKKQANYIEHTQSWAKRQA